MFTATLALTTTQAVQGVGSASSSIAEFCLWPTSESNTGESNRRDEIAISFTKLVQILEEVKIDNDFNVDVFVEGNSALANAKGEADALGRQLAYRDAGFDNDSGRAGCRIDL